MRPQVLVHGQSDTELIGRKLGLCKTGRGSMKKNIEKSPYSFWHGYFTKTTRRPINKRDATTVLVAFFFFLVLGAVVFVGWFDGVSPVKP